MEGTGGGLGALGFWLFIAAIIVAGTWYDVRRKESQQETPRRLVESGRDLDPVLIEKLLNAGASKSRERDLKVAGLITLSVAPGLLIHGFHFLYRKLLVQAFGQLHARGRRRGRQGPEGQGLTLAPRPGDESTTG